MIMNYSNPFKVLCIGMLMAGVTGCTPHRETFDCAPGIGVGCKSISEVNGLIDTKEREEEHSKDHGLQSKNTQPLPLARPIGSPGLRVWIAPYEDSNGHVHEESFVVLKPKPIDLEGETK